MDLTRGSVFRNLIQFAWPYLLACFLQTFYGVADLLIAGLYNGATVTSAISIGSQLMHMITLLLAGFAMAVTVLTGQAFGAGDHGKFRQVAGNAIVGFTWLALISCLVALPMTSPLLSILQTPPEAYGNAHAYTQICFFGIPLIAAFSVISAIFRGAGDTRSPMGCVAVAGFFNIVLDFLFMGHFGLGATGAAYATVIAQLFSVISAGIMIRRIPQIKSLKREDFRVQAPIMKGLLKIGVPTASQDGLIQIAFLVITGIANARGLYVSAAVGIVEKLICFFFLVPTSMLAAVSAIAAQNRGASLHERSFEVLRDGLVVVFVYGMVIGIGIQPIAGWVIALFTNDQAVIVLGTQYIRTYIFDAAFAGLHFCFSGFFCAYELARWTFIHNAFSALCIRIPGTWLASWLFPATLYEMGAVAPVGSIVSTLICVSVFYHYKKRGFKAASMNRADVLD